MSKKSRDQRNRPEDTPSTVQHLAAAMAALGKYAGENSDTEHSIEAERLGGMQAYQMSLANALLGIVEIDAMFADGSGVSIEQMDAAHRQALVSAGKHSSQQGLKTILASFSTFFSGGRCALRVHSGSLHKTGRSDHYHWPQLTQPKGRTKGMCRQRRQEG